MKIIKVIFILIFVFLLALAGVTAYVVVHARGLLVEQLNKNLGLEVKVGAVRIALPKTVMIEDVSIGPSVTFARLSVTPSILGFLRGEVILNSVVLEKPRATITRRADSTMDYGFPIPSVAAGTPAGAPAGTSGQTVAPLKTAPGTKRIYVELLKVVDGTVIFYR
jgi:hypothetical protein